MNIYPITFFFALIKYFPLFIRELVNHLWKRLLGDNSETGDIGQAKILGYILRIKGVKITDQRLQRLFSLLPNHISIDAKEHIPALLTEWNIKASVTDLGQSIETLDFSQSEGVVETPLALDNLYEITTPALVRLNNGKVAALLNIADDIEQDKKSIIIYDAERGMKLISFNDLKEIWAGAIFDFDTSHALKEPKFSEKISSENWQSWVRPGSILLSTLSILVILQFQLSHFSGTALFSYIAISLCLLAGLGLSLLLAQHSMGNSHGALAKYCANDSGHSCHKVLDSQQAKFLGITHADIGVAYFSGSLLLFFVSLLSINAHPYIHAIDSTIINLSFLAVLYSIYSIYLQKKIIKHWCRLCLYTQAVVILQAVLVLSFLGFSHHTSYEYFSTGLTLILLIIPGIIWYFLRKQLVTNTIQKEQQQQLESVISSDKIIETILASKQQRLNNESDFAFDEDEDLESDLILRSGSQDNNPEALRIVLGLSPSCEHCGSLLEEIYQFLQTDHYLIECRIRLIVGEGDTLETRIDRIIAEHITAFISNESEGQSVAINALRSWYQQYNPVDIKGWLATVRNISEAESVDLSVLLADTSFWVSQKDIKIIPAMYIENIHIPFVSEEFSTILLRKISTTYM